MHRLTFLVDQIVFTFFFFFFFFDFSVTFLNLDPNISFPTTFKLK